MIKQFNYANYNNVESIRSNNIKFLQHNCIKLTNVMLSCLKYATINKYDIILLQKS